jgi:DNA uptake protein ComE-like DNA-binding protein
MGSSGSASAGQSSSAGSGSRTQSYRRTNHYGRYFRSSSQTSTTTAGQTAAAGTSRSSSQTSTTTAGQTRSSSHRPEHRPPGRAFCPIADQITFSSQTVLPGKVNVNTAPLMVLYALLKDSGSWLKNILAYREGRSVGFATLEELGLFEGMTETILKQIIRSDRCPFECLFHCEQSRL